MRTASTSRHPYEIHAAAYGVALLLRADDEELLGRAAKFLPFGACILGAPGAEDAKVFSLLRATRALPFRVRHGNRTVVAEADLSRFLEGLHAQLVIAVAAHAPHHLFVHAGVAGWRGRAILLPGRSFAGKTTLTAELVRAGATYYSDEYALLDAEGLVHPYARALQMRLPGEVEQRGLDVAELGGKCGVGGMGVGGIFFVEYVVGGVWSPERVTPAMAVMEMIRHTPAIRRIPAGAMRVLAGVTQAAPAYRSVRGEAAETAALILSYLSEGIKVR